MASGWLRSAIYPFSEVQMLKNCSYFQSWEAAECDALISGLKEFREATHVSGMCLDADIRAKFPLILTPITNMVDRCVNQQRAMWLNKEGPITLRLEAIRLKEVARQRAATTAANRSAAARNGLAVAAALDTARAEGDTRVDGPPPENILHCGNPACDKDASAGNAIELAKWRGCNSCNLWFCHLKPCNNTMLMKHAVICRARQIVRGANVAIAIDAMPTR
jgi:hypothetical protein